MVHLVEQVFHQHHLTQLKEVESFSTVEQLMMAFVLGADFHRMLIYFHLVVHLAQPALAEAMMYLSTHPTLIRTPPLTLRLLLHPSIRHRPSLPTPPTRHTHQLLHRLLQQAHLFPLVVGMRHHHPPHPLAAHPQIPLQTPRHQRLH